MVVLYVFSGLLLSLLLLLAVPVEVFLLFDTSSAKKLRLRVSWLFGIVRNDMTKKTRRSEQKKPVLKNAKLKKQAPIPAFGYVRQLAPKVLRLVRDTVRRVKGDISGNLVIGFAEPDYTGMLFAAAGSLNAVLNRLPGYNVNLIPVFGDDDVFEGTIQAKLKVMPLRLVVPALRFGLSRETMGLVKTIVFRQREKPADVRV